MLDFCPGAKRALPATACIDDEKGLEEKVLEDVAMATGKREAITTGKGCYRDRRWLLWRWEMVVMEMGEGCYGDLVTVAMVT